MGEKKCSLAEENVHWLQNGPPVLLSVVFTDTCDAWWITNWFSSWPPVIVQYRKFKISDDVLKELKLFFWAVNWNTKKGGMVSNNGELVPKCYRWLRVGIENRRHACILRVREWSMINIKGALPPFCFPSIGGLKMVSIPGSSFERGEGWSDDQSKVTVSGPGPLHMTSPLLNIDFPWLFIFTEHHLLEGVRGHNFQQSSLENPRAPTPNTLHRSETLYVPPHRRRSHNPSPSLPPRWNSKRYLDFNSKQTPRHSVFVTRVQTPNEDLEVNSELLRTHHYCSIYLFCLAIMIRCIYHCSTFHCWYLYIAKDPS